MESLPQSHRHEKIGLSERYPRKMYCPSPSALQYLPQGIPFHHSLSFHGNIFSIQYGLLLRNLSVSFRVHFKEYFLNALLGSAGSANKSGWMSDQDFVLFMKRFIQHVRLSKENEVILLLDNQCSVCV
jgi:hypothetical protein